MTGLSQSKARLHDWPKRLATNHLSDPEPTLNPVKNGVHERLKMDEWSRIPKCPWRVIDKEGKVCCSYKPLQKHVAALNIAQYTLFDQRYVNDAIENLRENYPTPFTDPCSPRTCPRSFTRFANRIRIL